MEQLSLKDLPKETYACAAHDTAPLTVPLTQLGFLNVFSVDSMEFHLHFLPASFNPKPQEAKKKFPNKGYARISIQLMFVKVDRPG